MITLSASDLALLYWTKVQLTSLEILKTRKSTSKADIERQTHITTNMWGDCRAVLRQPDLLQGIREADYADEVLRLQTDIDKLIASDVG